MKCPKREKLDGNDCACGAGLLLICGALMMFLRNFMIQGGDPTGTGRGGESIWGKPFKDELNSKLLHSERGIVSMANSGPHSNGSQFFILYKSAQHLNYKHTVFGRIVGGIDNLSVMEKVPVDDDDRPVVRFFPSTLYGSRFRMNSITVRLKSFLQTFPTFRDIFKVTKDGAKSVFAPKSWPRTF